MNNHGDFRRKHIRNTCVNAAVTDTGFGFGFVARGTFATLWPDLNGPPRTLRPSFRNNRIQIFNDAIRFGLIERRRRRSLKRIYRRLTTAGRVKHDNRRVPSPVKRLSSSTSNCVVNAVERSCAVSTRQHAIIGSSCCFAVRYVL